MVRHEREVGDTISSAQPTYLITQQVEELEVCQATWASDIHETQTTQKREYRDFIIQLYQEYRDRLAQSQEGGAPTSSHDTKPPETIDGKEIVSAAINRMKSSSKQPGSESDQRSSTEVNSQEQSLEVATPLRSRRGSAASSLMKYASDNLENKDDGDKRSSQVGVIMSESRQRAYPDKQSIRTSLFLTPIYNEW